MIDLNEKRVVISRTDSIGDVMLTLPLCAWLKERFPTVTLLFLGKTYTKPVIEAYSSIDEFLNWSEIEGQPKITQQQLAREWNADVIIHVFPRKEIAQLAKSVKIPVRVGTSHRNFHLLTCNQRVNFTRKRSELHESQLNFNLVRPFGLTEIPSFEEVGRYTTFFKAKAVELPAPFDQLSNVIVLHPKSQGSAVEWPIEKYISLGKELVKNGYTVVFTGTESEGEQFRYLIESDTTLHDATGRFTLDQLICFISKSVGLVACSTGPLHIAGFLNVRAVGLYAPRKPIHPGRWKPLGSKVITLVYDEACETCRKGNACDCIKDIAVEKVIESITE